ncbi:thioredoxin domain-containing protein [Polaribacter sp. ALD11]|uniref:thioredoxin domain-containing protein n=1 Tax=Polaribacter sp. ALD11 TaxID=2058137 RepID=UPI000C30023D|nr:thioredoxin domain-containing protein [Polaribacter sp. ALD11]AUC86000.1 thioredoxin domain-containing protein [Polaribacter sp. ALD11]
MPKYETLIYLFFLIIFISCTENIKKDKHQFTNDLVHETSPYLLQHAHNPVNWKAWNEKSLATAKTANKLIVISVGYAACHWCHVMEEESFEDSIVAKIMNKNFINIKVDREERPDVDKVYMKAVQLMTGSGGWPLNVIALPDGRPIFGGTYFPKEQWLKILEQTAEGFKNRPEDFYAFADKLEVGIKDLDLVHLNTAEPVFTKTFIEKEVEKWRISFDANFGGTNNPPKFMMPNNYQFLMRYAYQDDDEKLMKHIENTLHKMAFGGIFDQINGGFSRYSVDKKWHIPHFEKMLYDNAQLVSLYANAYQITKNKTYKEVVYETLDFVKKELTSPEGMFYSSLDADSYNHEGKLEEGAYYSWTKTTLKTLLKSNFDLFSKYYNINDFGFWEEDKFVLIKTIDDVGFCKENNISISKLKEYKINWKKTLREEQEKRKKPRLDDKSLTSWNGLMITGYLDAYSVFNEKKYLDAALKNAHFILNNQLLEDGRLYHNYKKGKSSINGYLEDYAAIVEAFIKLHQVTSEEIWLQKAKELTMYAIEHFYDETSKMFYFTSKKDAPLVAKTIEYQDNVIASSNSIMAKNLFALSHHLSDKKYLKMATSMLNNIKPKIVDHAASFSNWLAVMLNYTNPYYEVVIAGKYAKKKLAELHKNYLPNILISYSTENSNLPLLENRFTENETYIYVCVNSSCKLPVTTISETLNLMEK